MEASYGAQFKSGAKVAASAKREAFTQNATTSVRARGGDISLAAGLTLADPDAPGAASVDLFRDWIESVKFSPAPVDFSLKGIWELCGSKRGAVESGWGLCGDG